jgi:hypothetical protein
MSPKKDGSPKPSEIICQPLPWGVVTPMPQVKVKLMKFEKIKKGEEITLSPETRALLERRKAGCFLCRFILEDEARNGMLTEYPFDLDGKGQFPVQGKADHIKLEKNSSHGDSSAPQRGADAKTNG